MPDPRKVKLVKLLRAKAARTNYPAEAEVCRTKAAEVMHRNGITEEDLAPPEYRQGYRRTESADEVEVVIDGQVFRATNETFTWTVVTGY